MDDLGFSLANITLLLEIISERSLDSRGEARSNGV